MTKPAMSKQLRLRVWADTLPRDLPDLAPRALSEYAKAHGHAHTPLDDEQAMANLMGQIQIHLAEVLGQAEGGAEEGSVQDSTGGRWRIIRREAGFRVIQYTERPS